MIATVFCLAAEPAGAQPSRRRIASFLRADALRPITPGLNARIARPTRTDGATLAGVVSDAAVLSQPGRGRRVWTATTTTEPSKEPLILLVLGSAVRRRQQWLRVLLPIRPDGSTGWIPRSHVLLLHTDYWVTIDEDARTVSVYDHGHMVHRYRAVVGKPSTPTPTGLAAIYEKDPQLDPTGFLGPWALPLTLLSNALRHFDGGPGRVAIHGRDGASLLDPLGTASSHGCTRIDNGPIPWMAHHLPQGTPVWITR